MGFKEKLEDYQRENFIDKHGDRLTPLYGNVLSIKVERSKFLFINKLEVNMVVKPAHSKNVSRARYKKSKWFNEPEFIDIKQGNEVLVQGLKGEKGKEDSEVVNIMNVVNITKKTQLVDSGVPVDEVIRQVRGSVKMQRK